jgi:hypothetical protein
METPAQLDRKERSAQRILALLVLFSGYFCANLLLRWLRNCLFHARMTYGWTEASTGTILYQMIMACLPVMFWAWIIYVVAKRVPRLITPLFLSFLMLLLMIGVELDMSWFSYSHIHLTVSDVLVYLTVTANPNDVGLNQWAIMNFAKNLATHVVAVGVFFLVSGWLGKLLCSFHMPARSKLNGKQVGLILAVLLLADSVWVGYCARHDHGHYNPSQWGFIAYANPARIAPLDRFWASLFHEEPDLLTASKLLDEKTEPQLDNEAKRVAVRTAPAAWKDYNIVIIMVESFNARAAAQTEMPYWRKLASRSLQLERHYSTGNCSQYGILGLWFGWPPIFYNGALGQAKSAFLDLFAARGYHTEPITCPLANYLSLGRYLANFTEPAVEVRDDWARVPRIQETLARPGPHVLFLFYFQTHYPYNHRAEYSHFQPEIAENFGTTAPVYFQSWDAARHRDEIVNRYKNCLQEFDAWLRAVLSGVDLDKTIVVVTGDHGEELFETGRLFHCSALNEAQTRVPCLIAIPGRRAETVKQITSHVDIMPTILDALGAPVNVPCYGQSVLKRGLFGSAVTAHYNRNHRPSTWAVITQGRKSILEGYNQLQLVTLLDQNDRQLQFSADPDSWSTNFAEVQRFRRTLLGAVVPGVEIEVGPLLNPLAKNRR